MVEEVGEAGEHHFEEDPLELQGVLLEALESLFHQSLNDLNHHVEVDLHNDLHFDEHFLGVYFLQQMNHQPKSHLLVSIEDIQEVPR